MARPPTPAVPGIGTSRTATARRLVWSAPEHSRFIPGGKVIDGALSRDPTNTGDLDVLRAGMVMGRVTTGTKYAPSIIGVLTAAYDQSASVNTTLTVAAATAVEIVRRIGATGTFKLTGPPTAGGTVAVQAVTYSAVNTTTGVITITAVAADAISGSFIQPDDGSETMLCLIPDTFGITVTDQDLNDIDVPFDEPLIGAFVDSSQIINWPSNTVLRTYVRTQLRNSTNLMFDDLFV